MHTQLLLPIPYIVPHTHAATPIHSQARTRLPTTQAPHTKSSTSVSPHRSTSSYTQQKSCMNTQLFLSTCYIAHHNSQNYGLQNYLHTATSPATRLSTTQAPPKIASVRPHLSISSRSQQQSCMHTPLFPSRPYLVAHTFATTPIYRQPTYCTTAHDPCYTKKVNTSVNLHLSMSLHHIQSLSQHTSTMISFFNTHIFLHRFFLFFLADDG